MSFGGPPPGGFGGPPPGGFGGPPPDGPPGGFGGPPPGGPPPGGGFGPPPGGGFGGPPPGGGFGPPPGGGFGGPPGGPFGPPPGSPFGPPGPFGAPVQAAPKSGSKLPLILGLGCGGLVLLGIIGGAVSFLMVRGAAPPPSPVSYDSPPVAPSPAVPSPASTNAGDLKAELKDLTPIKSKYGKSMRFVGEIHNTGSADIGYPSAKVTFYDAANTAVDSGVCGTLARVLPPGEKVPCMFSIFKGLDWKTYKIEMTPFRSTFRGQIADIAIADLKFKEKRGYQPDTLDGKLTNNSAFKAKNVWAIVTLYDANKKIVGADNALVAGSDLEASQSGLFSAKVYDVAGKPESYRVVAIGYSE